MSARPTYSDEFKADAVELVVSSGRSPPLCLPGARHFRYRVETLGTAPVKGKPEGGGKPDDPVDPAKYKALEARLRELERENDFLNYPDVRIMPMFA
jgi:transposase